jgi:hypothetical protein
MKSIDLNNQLIEDYMNLLQNLSHNSKLDLIAKLSQTLKVGKSASDKRFKNAFGAWGNTESAEDIITNIKNSRNFTRRTEGL